MTYFSKAARPSKATHTRFRVRGVLIGGLIVAALYWIGYGAMVAPVYLR